VSPTPIRPHSPAGSPNRDWGEGPTPKSAYLGPDYGVCDDEDAGEMCQELMEIFQGSPRCAPAGPVYCGVGERDSMQPPSRNQNPLVKDQRFSNNCGQQSEKEIFASKLSAALCGEIMRSAVCVSPQPHISEVGLRSS